MKNIKKILFLFIFTFIVIGLSACSLNNNENNLENESINNNINNSLNNDINNTKIDNNNNTEKDIENDNSLTLSEEGEDGVEDSEIKNENNKQDNLINNNEGDTNKQAISVSKPDLQKYMIDPNNFENLVSEYTGAIIKTNKGDITVKFYNNDSPFTVNNFLNLAKLGFYNQTKFHRIISDFMIQGGDPLTKDDESMYYGTGGPGYRFKDEINNHKLVKGSLAMANSGPNTNGSQFFIVVIDSTPWLDGAHTNFGEVVEGMDVVNEIRQVETGERDIPKDDVLINSIELIK